MRSGCGWDLLDEGNAVSSDEGGKTIGLPFVEQRNDCFHQITNNGLTYLEKKNDDVTDDIERADHRVVSIGRMLCNKTAEPSSCGRYAACRLVGDKSQILVDVLRDRNEVAWHSSSGRSVR